VLTGRPRDMNRWAAKGGGSRSRGNRSNSGLPKPMDGADIGVVRCPPLETV